MMGGVDLLDQYRSYYNVGRLGGGNTCFCGIFNIGVIDTSNEDAGQPATALKIVKHVHINADPSLENAKVTDLTISYDGSWMKCGHTSAHGIVCVIRTQSADWSLVWQCCHHTARPVRVKGKVWRLRYGQIPCVTLKTR